MSLTLIKKHSEKAFAWCTQHWRWLVFGLVALIAYLTGRRNAKNLWQQAELARKQYKAEAAAIEKAHAEKDKKIKKAEDKFNSDLKDLEKEKKDLENKLEKRKKSAILRLVDDQKKIDDALKNSGIDEV